MKRAAAYYRVSTSRQATEGRSLSSQRDEAWRRAEELGAAIVDEWQDAGVSARSADRPQFQKMMNELRARPEEFDFLIVQDGSRFMRKIGDHTAYRDELLSLGIKVVFGHRVLDADDPDGLTSDEFFAVKDGAFSRDQATRARRGHAKANALGLWSRRPPDPYVPDPLRRSVPKLDEERADLVRLGIEEVLRGSSLTAATELLNASGYRTSAGNPLRVQSLQKMLRNPFLAGRHPVTGKPGKWESLVAGEVFEQLQAVLDGRAPHRREPRKTDNPEFPLREPGWLTCGSCDGSVTAYYATGKSGKRHPYYQCPRCNVRARRDEAHEAFLALVADLTPTPAYLQRFKQVVRDVWKLRRQDATKIRRKIQAEIDRLMERRDNISEDRIVRTIDAATCKRKLAETDADIGRARGQLRAASRKEGNVEDALRFVDEVVFDLGKLWSRLSVEKAKALQGWIFPEGLVWDFEARGFRTPATNALFATFALLGSERKDWQGHGESNPGLKTENLPS